MSPPLRAFDLVGMVREFRESLGREMDFRLEAQSIARFRAALADTPGVWIPDTVSALSTQAVLTEEFSRVNASTCMRRCIPTRSTTSQKASPHS